MRKRKEVKNESCPALIVRLRADSGPATRMKTQPPPCEGQFRNARGDPQSILERAGHEDGRISWGAPQKNPTPTRSLLVTSGIAMTSKYHDHTLFWRWGSSWSGSSSGQPAFRLTAFV